MPTGIPQTDEDQWRTGTLIGSGIGGLQGIAETALVLARARPAPCFARSSFPAA